MTKPRSDLVPNTADYENLPLVTANGFREYDARWLFGKEINLLGIQALGLGLGTYLQDIGVKPKVVTGHDFRSYSLSIKQALTIGLMLELTRHIGYENARMHAGESWQTTMGRDIEGSSFSQQLDFVQWELTHTESGAGRALHGATSASDAGSIVTRLYERPADTAGEAARPRSCGDRTP